MKKIKLFTFYSDTHEILFNEWFLKTIPNDIELVVKKIPQECPTGEFESDGWMLSMIRKIEYIIECCEKETDVFIHADCDIQFFQSFKNEILTKMKENNLDILSQEDIPVPVCCGFMAIKPGKVTAEFFKEVIKVMNETSLNDQHATNLLLRNGYPLRLGLLDERYYSVWRTLNGVWDGYQKLSPPKNMVMHHANFVEVVDRKINCMEVVRKEYLKALDHELA